MSMNPINFLYNQGHVTLGCMEVGLVANARECSMQELDWMSLNMIIYDTTLFTICLQLAVPDTVLPSQSPIDSNW